VAGHEYDRNMDVRLGELGLEVEARLAPQSDVEHEAARHIGKFAAQEVAPEPNVSTLRLTDRNRLLSASRIDSSSSTTNTVGSSAVRTGELDARSRYCLRAAACQSNR